MELLDACRIAVDAASGGGAQAEAYALRGRTIRVQLERNDVKLGNVQSSRAIGVRVLRDAGLGYAHVNALEREEVEAAARAAHALAGSVPKDPNHVLPEPQPIRPVDGLYDPAAYDYPVDDAMEAALEMLRTAREYDPRVTVDSGVFLVQTGEDALLSTAGVEATQRSSGIIYFLLGMAHDDGETSSFQYEFDGARAVKDVDVATVAETMARKAIASLGTRKTESFKGTVILSPSVVQELLSTLIEYAVDANHVQKGMSRFQDALGEPVAATDLTVQDDGTRPGELGSASYDREGLPHRPTTLIEEGVLQRHLHNTYTATKAGAEGTSHAAGDVRGPPTIGTTNFIIGAGDTALEDLMADVRRGLLVTRLSTAPHPVSGDFSGVVKGGQLIEKGEAVHPVKETLLAGNVYDMLHAISGLSKERKRILTHLVPYIVVDGVSVTGG